MLKQTEIKKGKVIELDEDPYEVLEHSHKVKARGKSVMQTKLRNMRTGTVLKRNFHPSETVEEADMDEMNAVFIYSKQGKYVFHKEGDPSDRFELQEEQVGDKKEFLVQDVKVSILLFEEKMVGISLPPKIQLKVEEAPPGVKGNTAEGGTKRAVLESGKEVDVPLFVEMGDVVEINTQTGEYVRRIKS